MALSSQSKWSEVIAARDENRKELNLQGQDVNKRIEKKGLDEAVFELTGLNLLKIAGTSLTHISSSLGNLKNLTSLNMENNKLEELPNTVGNLISLKFVDISGNKFQSLPDEFSKLVNLQSLNANLNSLNSFPDVSGMKSLAFISLSRNQLSSLPNGICNSNLALLSTIEAAHNQILSIPSEISQLSHLIKLNLSHNKMDSLPLELCECLKLKEVTISENRMKEDKKSLKLADHSTKALLAHLSNLLQKQRASGGAKSKKNKSKGKKGGKAEMEDLVKDVMSVLKFDHGLTVSVKPDVLTVRPYIVCCVLRNLNFAKSVNMFKRFITIQTKLHDSICDKRQVATIATHDLKSLKGPLVYDAASPADIQIIPLFKTKLTTAFDLVNDLRSEAEAYRKEKKKSAISGIHKYIYQLNDFKQYPCLMDSDGDCISFPPMTNSDKTKISKETTDILVEVTGQKTLDSCKMVMEEFLKATLLTGLGTPTADDGTVAPPGNEAEGRCEEEEEEEGSVGDNAGPQGQHSLMVEQVKIVDHEGRLRVLYPSRDDLQDSAFDVIRNYD